VSCEGVGFMAYTNVMLQITCRVGQNRIYTPYITVCMVISLPEYRMYTVYTHKYMVLVPNYALRACCLMAEAALCLCIVYDLRVYMLASVSTHAHVVLSLPYRRACVMPVPCV